MKNNNDIIKTAWNRLRNKVFSHQKLTDDVIEMGLKIESDNISLLFYLRDINKNKSSSIINELIKDIFNAESINDNRLIQYLPCSTSFCEMSKDDNMKSDHHFRDESLDLYDFRPQKTRNRYVFKYSPINQNLSKLLINNTLWFGAAAKFNDAFDSRFIMDHAKKRVTDGTKVISAYRKKGNLNFNPFVPNPDFNEYKKNFKIPSDAEFRGGIEEYHFQTTISPYFGVCCFSENYEEQLMWSHYAESYKGVCLVFDQTFDDKYIGTSKVLYRDTLHKIFWDRQAKVVESIFFTKHNRWSYEKELRSVVRPHNLSEPIKDSERSVEFTPGSLVGVIFGHNCVPDDKQTIKNLINQLPKYKKIHFWDAYPNIQEQKIDVDSGDVDLKELIN